MFNNQISRIILDIYSMNAMILQIEPNLCLSFIRLHVKANNLLALPFKLVLVGFQDKIIQNLCEYREIFFCFSLIQVLRG